MALEQCVPDQFGHCLPCQLCSIQRCPEDCLAGFRGADVAAHADRLVDDVRHTCFQVNPGKDAFCRGISHLNRGNNEIGFIFVFGYLHARSVHEGRRRWAFNNMGFLFCEAGKKTGTHVIRFSPYHSL